MKDFFFTRTALARSIETDYPRIGVVTGEGVVREGFPEYIVYVVYFLVVLAIIVTILSLVRGGLLWMISEGDPLKVKSAKEQLSSALMGLFLVLSSFLLLSALDPVLVTIEDVAVEETREDFPTGVHFSRNKQFSMEDEVYRVNTPIRDLEELRGEFQSFRIANEINEEGELFGYYYGVILHEEPFFRGRCEFFINSSPEPEDFRVPGDFSSVTVVQIRKDYQPQEENYVKVYELPDFREDHSYEYLDTEKREFSSLSVSEVWSMEIKGNYGVILSSGDGWESADEGCGVFLSGNPVSDLKGHHMNKCNAVEDPPLFGSYNSCATHYIAFPIF